LLTAPTTTKPQQQLQTPHTHPKTTNKLINQSKWAAAETPDAPVPAAAVLLAPALAAYVLIACQTQSQLCRVLTLPSAEISYSLRP
jgi:hypothetical protein